MYIRGGQGESLVPPHTRVVSLSLSAFTKFHTHIFFGFKLSEELGCYLVIHRLALDEG